MQKRVMAVHDISCFGKCSLTAALPILSAAGIEVCPVPTAILSTHTGGFEGYTFEDLTHNMLPVVKHFKELDIKFNSIYSGYLGSFKQIEYMKTIISMFKQQDTLVMVDPVMGDNGKLYAGFDMSFAKEMASLCKMADIIVPNVTEAAFMTGVKYINPPFTTDYFDTIIERLKKICAGDIVITGAVLKKGQTGVVICHDGNTEYITEKESEGMYHGTGDVFASTLLAGLLNGFSLKEAGEIAAKFIPVCIEKTKELGVFYGVNFEQCIPDLLNKLKLT
ncbi:MAG: pyridoxamine kinase [Clostridia bacterium]|nr:pyridoxamine kinase [Clostridia bacterium]